MLDARPSRHGRARTSRAAGQVPRRSATSAEPKKPVCIVLHQENSNPGHVGQWFVRNGHALDIRKPRFGEPLPETLREPLRRRRLRRPMSANDKDEFIVRETEWIGVALKEGKPYPRHLPRRADAGQPPRRQGRLPSRRAGRDRLLSARHDAPRACASGRFPDHVYQWHREGCELAQRRAAARHIHTAPIPTRPSPTARPSACSSIPRSPTPRCIAGPATAPRAST